MDCELSIRWVVRRRDGIVCKYRISERHPYETQIDSDDKEMYERQNDISEAVKFTDKTEMLRELDTRVNKYVNQKHLRERAQTEKGQQFANKLRRYVE